MFQVANSLLYAYCGIQLCSTKTAMTRSMCLGGTQSILWGPPADLRIPAYFKGNIKENPRKFKHICDFGTFFSKIDVTRPIFGDGRLDFTSKNQEKYFHSEYAAKTCFLASLYTGARKNENSTFFVKSRVL